MTVEKEDRPKVANSHLRDLRDLSQEERKKIASEGGKASGEARRLKGTFREIAKNLLELNAPKKVANKIKKIFPDIPEEDIDNRAALICSQLARALNGDTRAFEVIRDTAGEKPVDKVKTQVVENIDIDLDGEEYD